MGDLPDPHEKLACVRATTRQAWLWLGGLSIASALILVLVAATPRGTSRGISVVPGLKLGPEDYILGADLVCDEEEVLHVVYSIRYERPGRSAVEPVLYSRGEQGGKSWSEPVELLPEGGKAPRMVITRDRIHVLFRPSPYGSGLDRVRHLVSEDRGKSWTEVEPLLAPAEMSVETLDVAAVGETLIAPCLLLHHAYSPWEEPTHAEGALKLVAVRWQPDRTRVVELASFSGSKCPRRTRESSTREEPCT